jgi:hypothetical protein
MRRLEIGELRRRWHSHYGWKGVHDGQRHDGHSIQLFDVITNKTFVFLAAFVVLDTLFTLTLWFFLRLANIAILTLLAL